MKRWIEAARLADLPPGEKSGVRVGGLEIALFNVEGRIFAIEDHCPHFGAPLSEVGHVRGCDVICVLHGARFDLETGRVLADPAERDIETYDTRLEGDRVLVAIEETT